MIIKRVLNNNTIISSNSKGVEVLLMGKGISYGKKKGEEVDIEKIDKTFLLRDKATQSKFTELLINVPMEHILVAEKIINFGKIKLGKNLNEIIYVNLTDHIHSAVERYAEGLILKNPLRWDIARFYQDEYAVGEKAVEIIQKELDIALDIDEAAFIALHFVNAEAGKSFDLAYDVTEITKKIEEIVKEEYHTEFDERSLDYYRFITHVKFFAQRLLTGEHYEDEDEELLDVMKQKYQNEFKCASRISEYVKAEFKYDLSSTELLYLTAHIRRITKNL
ncbi:transcription antiterminator BglG [Oceanobacillus oncorhynchi subsp. incaldanensis]|uniref:BglG family transcription antiterminator LicT n=1 Tax=Oceanobacillus oncorhynchi TaxID=545501 RepID=UPI001B2E0764|nr:PRD domain-containing protein [Oceanobacillus oncorhynchi]GIO19667.1 transcription antiterminator BglG [Oceanobacillus oncorhynchi subsp. incaldanensis]